MSPRAGSLLEDAHASFALRQYFFNTLLGGLRPPSSGHCWLLAFVVQFVVYFGPLVGLVVARQMASGLDCWQLAAVFATWGVVCVLLVAMLNAAVGKRKVPGSTMATGLFWNDYDAGEVTSTCLAALAWGLRFNGSSMWLRLPLVFINFGLLAWVSVKGLLYFILSAISVATIAGCSLLYGWPVRELAPRVCPGMTDSALSRSLTILPLLVCGFVAVEVGNDVLGLIVYAGLAACPVLWAVGLLPPFEDALLWLIEFAAYYFCGAVNPLPIVPLALVAPLAFLLVDVHLVLLSFTGVCIGLLPPLRSRCPLEAIARHLLLCSAGIGIGFTLHFVVDPVPLVWWAAAGLGLAQVVLLGSAHIGLRYLATFFMFVSLVLVLAVDEATDSWYISWLSLRHFISATSGCRGVPFGLSVAVVGIFLVIRYDTEDPDGLPEVPVLLMVADFALEKLLTISRGVWFGAALVYHSFRSPKQAHRGQEVSACLAPVMLPVACLVSNDNTPLPLFTAPLFAFRPWLPAHVPLATGNETVVGLQGLLCRSLVTNGGLVKSLGRLFLREDLLLFREPEEGMLFIGKVTKRWYGGCTVELRFSELADQTSCHQAEARAVDAAFAGNRSVWALRPLSEALTVGQYQYTRMSLAGVVNSEGCLRAIWRGFGMVLLVMLKRLEDTFEVNIEDMSFFERALRYFPNELANNIGIEIVESDPALHCRQEDPAVPPQRAEISIQDDLDALLEDVLPLPGGVDSNGSAMEESNPITADSLSVMPSDKLSRLWLMLFSSKARLPDRFGADPVAGGSALVGKAWTENIESSYASVLDEAFERGCVLGLETFITTGSEHVPLGDSIDFVEDCERSVKFVGDAGGASWAEAMSKGIPTLCSLLVSANNRVDGFIRLVWKEASSVGVARMNKTAFDAIQSATALDLTYFANSDDERYGIQQHEEMLRNLIVQLNEYPVETGFVLRGCLTAVGLTKVFAMVSIREIPLLVEPFLLLGKDSVISTTQSLGDSQLKLRLPSSPLSPSCKGSSPVSNSTAADGSKSAVSSGSFNLDSSLFDFDRCQSPKESDLLAASEYLKTSLQDLEDSVSSISTTADNATKPSTGLTLPLGDLATPDLSFFADEESLTDAVRPLLESSTNKRVMLAVHARLMSMPPSANWIIDQLSNASRILLVISPTSTSLNDIRCAVCVAVMRTEEEADYLCTPGRLGSRVTVTSFFNPVLPGTNDLVSIPGSKDLMQIDEICEMPDGTPSICGVMALGDVKMLLPQDEAECQARVLMVKRCHKLGARCSLKLKAYFDTVLGHDGAVEHVLMLPLKARCTARRGVPPKTGFVVFRQPTDAMLARALGSEQIVEPEASIKVETFDGM
ncbi:pecanex-like 4 [Perkinsus chesapeaki]|uniref:Pecanex-like 4 n=1 Tax=Perkinsus chesapeaki TaxID=330153 RepID=A0A7J6MFF5_PERCH|nr:pecanex-like 4 [Perkinsus chesapeaki]